MTPFEMPMERTASRLLAGQMTRPLLMAVSKVVWEKAEVVDRAARRWRRESVI
jgi:hypothetical protein